MKKQRLPVRESPRKHTSLTTPLSKRKVWLFRFLAVVMAPVLFFTVLEAGLRGFDYGYSPRAIITHRLETKDVYCHNYKFGWRFFPRSIARHFEGFVFDTQKSPDTYRIFVLGASAALGTPAPAYSVGRILEVMLDEMYPEIDFEVHTVAMPAINSHVVLEIAKDCARHRPDLFIVYMGNNEIVGPYGPGTVFAPLSPSLSMIRANIAFKSTRTGQLLEQVLQEKAFRRGTTRPWNGLEMFVDKTIRHDDPALEVAYRNFEKNLRDICRTGLDAGAAVIVSNVGSNLKDSPPFASLHRLDLSDREKQTWQDLYRAGAALEEEGRFEEAIEKYREAERIDTAYADLQFRLGTCYWNTGDFPAARERYLSARQYDALRFRADNRINDIIRRVADTAQEDRLYFADSVGAFEACSPHHIPDAELFYEHVHLKFKGNYILAGSILPHIQKALPAAWQPAAPQVIGEEEAARRLAYTGYERVVYLNMIYEHYLSRPPFTGQLYYEQTLANTKQQIDQQLLDLRMHGIDACLLQHRQAVQDRPDDWVLLFQYAAFLNSGRKDLKAEEAQLLQVIKRCPYRSAYLNLGINLHRQGRLLEAQSFLYEVLELNPNEARAHIELASIYRRLRDHAKEIQHLVKALSLDPEGVIGTHIQLAHAYNQTGNPDQAIRVLYNAVSLFPEEQTAGAHALLAQFLFSRGDAVNALKEIQQAEKSDPAIKNNPSFNALKTNIENSLNP